MPSKKLYVGNIPNDVSENDLNNLFSQAGNVESVKIINDFSGRSKGFGFIEMSSIEEAQNAINMFNKYNLKDKELRVDEARPMKKDGDRGGYHRGGGSNRFSRGGGGGGGRRDSHGSGGRRGKKY
jgi:RNA recognition motif-containing protein